MSVNYPSNCSSINWNSHQSCLKILSYLSFMNTIWYHLKIFINPRTKKISSYRNIKAALWRCKISGDDCTWHVGLWIKFLFLPPVLLCLGKRKNRRRTPWESLALTTTRRVRPTLDQLLESTNVMVLPLGCSQPPVSHSSPDMGLWFDNLARGRTGRGKIAEDHILSQCSLLFLFTFLHLEPTRHFICMTFLHLSFYLPFKVAS